MKKTITIALLALAVIGATSFFHHAVTKTMMTGLLKAGQIL